MTSELGYKNMMKFKIEKNKQWEKTILNQPMSSLYMELNRDSRLIKGKKCVLFALKNETYLIIKNMQISVQIWPTKLTISILTTHGSRNLSQILYIGLDVFQYK